MSFPSLIGFPTVSTRIYAAVVGSAALLLCAVSVSAEGFSMPVAEFQELTDEGQAIVLHKCFLARLEHANNIRYKAVTILRNYKATNGRLGDLEWQGLKYRFQRWRLGDSFAVETELYGPPEESVPKHFSRTNYDAETGLSTSASDTGKRKVGAIDYKLNSIANQDRYRYWLDGTDNRLRVYLFRDLVESKDHYEIEVAEMEMSAHKMVKLTIPWNDRMPGAIGTWEYYLDPTKSFMPVRGIGKWRVPLKDSEPKFWREETFDVNASRKIADVWMPLRFREELRSSTIPGVANVWETEVSEIEHGNVTPSDLRVEFHDGALVSDRTKQIAYVIGPDGNPKPGSQLKIGAVPKARANTDSD